MPPKSRRLPHWATAVRDRGPYFAIKFSDDDTVHIIVAAVVGFDAGWFTPNRIGETAFSMDLSNCWQTVGDAGALVDLVGRRSFETWELMPGEYKLEGAIAYSVASGLPRRRALGAPKNSRKAPWGHFRLRWGRAFTSV